MDRLSTVRWHSPPPTSVDEELALYDDGTAWLAVRRSRDGEPVIGTWSTTPAADDHAALAAADLDIDLLAPSGDTRTAIADRVAKAALAAPVATAAFHTGVTADRRVSVLVVAAGTRPVRFEADPDAFRVHLEPVTWREVPRPESGFVTPSAEGLGGIARIAEVEPGVYGAIALTTLDDTSATEVSVQLAGWLLGGLPDHPMPEPFEVRTAGVPIG
jgi:hypothetical protein